MQLFMFTSFCLFVFCLFFAEGLRRDQRTHHVIAFVLICVFLFSSSNVQLLFKMLCTLYIGTSTSKQWMQLVTLKMLYTLYIGTSTSKQWMQLITVQDVVYTVHRYVHQ